MPQRTGSFDLDDSIDVLRRTPATLQALLAALPEPLVRANEGSETFSPFDVIGRSSALLINEGAATTF